MLGSETAETNLRTMLLPCYLQLLGVDVGERDCGDESADAAVSMLFAAVGGRCWGARLRRRICGRCCYHAIYLQLLGVDVGERDCGDESADDAVPMLFAAVGGRCWGTRLRRRICGRFCYHAICSCWVMLPCYLQLLGVDVGERDCGDESADDDVTMLFAAVGGIDVGERARGDESADVAVTMLFAAWV